MKIAAALCLAFAAVARCEDRLPIVAEGCTKSPQFYEDSHYRLAGDIEFRGGFAFLRSIRQLVDPAADPRLRKGAAFEQKALLEYRDKLQNKLSAAASEERVHVGIVQIYLEGCTPPATGQRELRVNIRVFDSSPALPTFRLFESRKLETEDAAGAARPGGRLAVVSLTPRAFFNPSDRVSAGASLNAKVPNSLIESLQAEGTASGSGSRANLNLSGERNWETGFLQSASWQFGFQHLDRPAGDDSLASSAFYGRVQFTSHPLAEFTVFRVASELAGGNAQTTLSQDTLPENTLASAANRTWKTAAGLTARVGPHAVTASYGIQLGSTGGGRTLDYHKHLADVAYSTYKLVGNHKLIEYETRFTAGGIRTPGQVPAAERFFGGNRETSFFSGSEFANDWRIRSNPYVRGIAANLFNGAAPGAVTGGEGFIAWNNTIVLPLPFYQYPLLPKDVVEAPEFKAALKEQLGVARSNLIVSYTADDQASKEAANKIPAVDASLVALGNIVDGIGKAGGPAQSEAQACAKIIRNKRVVLEEAENAMEIVINEEDPEAVIPSVMACVGRVDSLQPTANFAPQVAALKDVSREISALLVKIDTRKVKNQAERDVRLAERIMNVFFQEAVLVGINPMVVFDVARLTTPVSGADRFQLRYSIGGGLRLQFARVLNLTVGYAANPRRRTGEKPGAFFASMDILDLFR